MQVINWLSHKVDMKYWNLHAKFHMNPSSINGRYGRGYSPVRPDGDHPRPYGDQKMYKVAGKREHARKS